MDAITLSPRRSTSAEFIRIAQSGGFGDLRLELRQGWIVEIGPQFAPHAGLKATIYDALRDALRRLASPLKIWSEASIDFAEGFQPMPDIVIWDLALTPAALDGPLPARAVKLVVEVAASTLKDDLGAKALEYSQAGLPEYWVADVKAQMLYRHADPGEGGFARREPLALSDEIACRTIPGLAIAAGTLI
jgi:Uma2 family endonuclease